MADVDQKGANDEQKEIQTYAVGIDLGTTYSCIAVWKDGKVEIIPNSLNELTTPSVVAFTDTECLIGESARQQSSLNPINTIYENKRVIGRKYKDHTVQDDIERYPFSVIPSNNTKDTNNAKPAFEVSYKSEQVLFQPEQISAMILSQLRKDAKTYLNAEVINAVITVPAYFTDSQREATKDAGTIAGFNVLRCLNEPTAAAIAYGLDVKHVQKQTEESRILIFDLGGGTFDVSVLTILDGFFEVKATAGDTHLGGEDFDNRITDYIKTQLIQEYIESYPHIVQDIHNNPSLLRELRTKCERLKCELSLHSSSEICINYKTETFKYTLTRTKFENLCSDLFQQCLEPIEQVLRDSELTRDEIDEVVLVGGSTRVLKIKEMITDFFKGKEPCTSIDPDAAIAYGAAVQSVVLSTTDTNRKSNKNNSHDLNVFLLDVCPLSLGLGTDNGKMTVLIPRNTALPCEKTETFTTLYDSQTCVLIEVFEGERMRVGCNNHLGRFTLNGIATEQRGIPQIDVTFSVNENGILSVTAIDKQNQANKGNLVITNDKGRLRKEEIEAMILSADKHKKEDLLLKGKLKAFAAMELYLYALKRVIEIKGSGNHRKLKKKRSGFKLFGGGKKKKRSHKNVSSSDGISESVEEESKDNNTLNNDLLMRCAKISDKSVKNIKKLYETYSVWLSDHGHACVDNQQIDAKQKELENKLGKDVAHLLADSCLIANSLSLVVAK